MKIIKEYKDYIREMLSDGMDREDILSSGSDEIVIYESYYDKREGFIEITTIILDELEVNNKIIVSVHLNNDNYSIPLIVSIEVDYLTIESLRACLFSLSSVISNHMNIFCITIDKDIDINITSYLKSLENKGLKDV